MNTLDKIETIKSTERLNKLDKEYTIINNFLSLFNELNKDNIKIFLEFNILSDLLEKSKLNDNECTTIIFIMIKKI